MQIVGVKKGMTTILNKYNVVPVTVVDVSTTVVANKLVKGEDHFLVIGYGKAKKPNKALQGVYKELGYVPTKVIEVKVSKDVFDKLNVGDALYEKFIKDMLANDEKPVVDVTGISKGKGFAGVIKRWNFHRQPKTHGQSDRERHTGSIGAQTPGRVLKGKKMPGRMGNQKVTMKNLELVDFVEDDQAKVVLIKGAVPGPKNRYVVIKFKD